MKQYPDAKIILVERDFDKWCESIKETVYLSLCVEPTVDPKHKIRLLFKSDMILDGIFKDKESLLDKERVRALYEKHNNNWVKENVPIIKTGEGWDRLCAFLSKEIPNVPFPHKTSTPEFQFNFFQKSRKSTKALLRILLAVLPLVS